jgi:antitoxin (DNA-binding transcriptional repressor) of toxin-antitoxin stability system
MKATILDFRRRMSAILRALDQNESVTITYRGKKRGVIVPAGLANRGKKPLACHPAFGMWKNRKDMRDVRAVMDELRRTRRRAV